MLRVPEAAERVDGTRFGYRTGWRIRRDQLLTTLLLVSANDAAETLAAAWPDGGRAGFLQAMQAKAVELGCTDSTWRDPSGLDAPGHRAGAADLAVLGQALLERPVLAKLVGSRVAPYVWPGGRRTVLGNHNHFVGQGRDPGALGVKTGYTTRAGSPSWPPSGATATLVTVVSAPRSCTTTCAPCSATGSRSSPRSAPSCSAWSPTRPARRPPTTPTRPCPGRRARHRPGLGQPVPPGRAPRPAHPGRPAPAGRLAGVACLLLGALALLWRRRYRQPGRGLARRPRARSSRSARAWYSPARRSPARSGVTRWSSRSGRLATARMANSSRSAPSRRSRLAAPPP